MADACTTSSVPGDSGGGGDDGGGSTEPSEPAEDQVDINIIDSFAGVREATLQFSAFNRADETVEVDVGLTATEGLGGSGEQLGSDSQTLTVSPRASSASTVVFDFNNDNDVSVALCAEVQSARYA